MAVRKNKIYWLIILFISILQLYFFKQNSGLDKPFPVLNRISSTDVDGSGYGFWYLALLTPIFILIFYFAEWKSFYVDSYGILQITRSVNVYKYMASICGKIALQVFYYVGMVMVVNYICDYQYANRNIEQLIALLGDYYIATVNICILVFLLSLLWNRQLTVEITIVVMICTVFISQADKTQIADKILFFNHIVKQPDCNNCEEYILNFLMGISWSMIMYIICGKILRNKEFYGGNHESSN